MNRKTRRMARIILALLFIGTGGGAVGSLFGALRGSVGQAQFSDVMVTPRLLTPLARGPIVTYDDPLLNAGAAEGGQPGQDAGEPGQRAALMVGQQDSPPAPSTPEQRAGSTPASAAAGPPPGAAPMAAGDVDVRTRSDGRLQAAGAAPSRLTCDSDALLRVETGEGTVFLGIAPSAGWNCQVALQRWSSISPAQEAVGVRYAPAGSGASQAATLVNQDGESMFLGVTGAWQQ